MNDLGKKICEPYTVLISIQTVEIDTGYVVTGGAEGVPYIRPHMRPLTVDGQEHMGQGWLQPLLVLFLI